MTIKVKMSPERARVTLREFTEDEVEQIKNHPLYRIMWAGIERQMLELAQVGTALGLTTEIETVLLQEMVKTHQRALAMVENEAREVLGLTEPEESGNGESEDKTN